MVSTQAWYTSMECRCVQLRTVVSYWHLTNPSHLQSNVIPDSSIWRWFSLKWLSKRLLLSDSHDHFCSNVFDDDFCSKNSTWLHLTTTWLWRWLPLRLLKRRSQTTVFLRTPITQMIFFIHVTVYLSRTIKYIVSRPINRAHFDERCAVGLSFQTNQ